MEKKRFHLRDIETKEIKTTFKGETAARDYLISMRFGLNNFYEVYDSRIDKVIFQTKDKKNRSRSS